MTKRRDMDKIKRYYGYKRLYGKIMKFLSTSIEIKATPERVWKVLTDFSSYSSWNPFIRSISGQLEVGKSLTIVIQSSANKTMTFRPKLLVLKKNQEIRWLSKLFVPGIFDGDPRFEIEQLTENTVSLIQSEIFRGILLPFLGKILDQTKEGFESMNQALKSRVEEGK